jgi:hypothetical protein
MVSVFDPYPQDVEYMRRTFKGSRTNLGASIERRTAEVEKLKESYLKYKQDETNTLADMRTAQNADDRQAAHKAHERLKRISDTTGRLLASIRHINAFLIVANERTTARVKRKSSPLSFGEMLEQSSRGRR